MSDTSDSPRILVVDDEPNIVEVITMALRPQGFDRRGRRDSGREALAEVASFNPT